MGLGYSTCGKKKRKGCQKNPQEQRQGVKTKQKNNFERRHCFYPRVHHCFVFFLIHKISFSSLLFSLFLSLATTRISNNDEELLLLEIVLVAPSFQPFLCHQQPNKGAHAWEGDFSSIWNGFIHNLDVKKFIHPFFSF